ncbi:AtpZ/AtpI family protein [Alphaproteobacteria bacterium]|nr:AtpZ/AtpI family protein [Alphaproteobacteria bacterium]
MEPKNQLPKTDRKSERDRLTALEGEISEVRKRHQPVQEDRANMSSLGLAWRMTIEMMVGIGIGGYLGWWLDKALETKPIFMLVLLVLGMAAGLLNSVRMVSEMRRKQDEKDLRPNGSQDEE